MMIKKHDLYAGIVFIVLGIFVILYSLTQLSLGNIKLPGPGFFPFICGCLIVVFSSIWLFVASKDKSGEDAPFWENNSWRRPLLAAVLICAYGAIMEPIGYLVSTFVFVCAWQFIIERAKIIRMLVIAVTASAVMYLLFTFLLHVPLPSGLFI